MQQFAPISDDEIFEAHIGGKLSVELTAPINDKRDLSIAYTPGVAKVSDAIHKNPEMAKSHTWANRLVVVVGRHWPGCFASGDGGQVSSV
jgi:malate dehydrogenase (oxaloacetate-decarboxylating)